MTAIQTLEHQHQQIGLVARACGIFAQLLEQGTTVPPAVLMSVADFLNVFDDRYHRDGEARLFGILRAKGIPAGGCPMGALTHEYLKLQVLRAQLASAAGIYATADGTIRDTLIGTLQALSELYAEHLWKEDYLLLPMAAKVMSDGDLSGLAESLEALRVEKGPDADRALAEVRAAIQACPDCGLDSGPIACSKAT